MFGDRRVYSDYQRACEVGLSELRIEIEGDSPAFQALHWEVLKDPDLPRPLVVERVFTRKRFQVSGLPVRLSPSSEINLLVVTARPDEESDTEQQFRIPDYGHSKTLISRSEQIMVKPKTH